MQCSMRDKYVKWHDAKLGENLISDVNSDANVQAY